MDLGLSVGDSHSCNTHTHEETSKTCCVCVCMPQCVRELCCYGVRLQEYRNGVVPEVILLFSYFLQIAGVYLLCYLAVFVLFRVGFFL